MKLLIIATFLVLGSSAFAYPQYYGYRQNIQCMQMYLNIPQAKHVHGYTIDQLIIPKLIKFIVIMIEGLTSHS